jgi:mannose-6-phosphate isomerase-like protein (cupin superfamily)
MKNFVDNIQELTIQNTNFRKVLYTGPNMQLVVMNLLPKENIGLEVHEDTDQFFRVESGEGILIMDSVEYEIKDDMAFVVPAGLSHDVLNTSAEHELKLYTIYAPAHHLEGTVHKSKQDSQKD